MARKIPEERFEQLVDAAIETFIARGFRLTQMSDIAKALSVAKETLYGYVESKDALFALCLYNADRVEPLALPEGLPLPTPPAGKPGGDVKELVANAAIPAPLLEALERDRADDPAAELEGIVRSFYETLERFCRSIKLVDRCTDHPELQDIWQTSGWEAPRAALVQYLEARIAARQLGAVGDARLGVRIIIETCTTWAVHIKWDRAPEDFDPDEARDEVVAVLVSGLALQFARSGHD